MSFRVLIVEDDLLVRMPIEEALDQAGIEWAATANAEQAEALLAKDGTKYHALLTDIELGGRIDGWELARRARRINPELAVIYMSGAHAHLWALHGVSGSLLFNKPTALESIVSALHRWQSQPGCGSNSQELGKPRILVEQEDGRIQGECKSKPDGVRDKQ